MRTPKKKHLTGLLVFVLLLLQQNVEGQNVLFVGNSYTYYNAMPLMVEEMGQANNTNLNTYALTKGGQTLKGHWDTEAAHWALKAKRWDFVVIQDHSMQTIIKPDTFAKYVSAWCQKIKATQAQPVLYCTWPRDTATTKTYLNKKYYEHFADYNSALKTIMGAYLLQKNKHQALMAPVGKAFFEYRKQKGQSLYVADKSHPSYIGSCLAAITLYRAITGQLPNNKPATIALNQQEYKRLLLAAENAF